jgi:hypothetical protein
MPILITRARVHPGCTAGLVIGMLQDGTGISIRKRAELASVASYAF